MLYFFTTNTRSSTTEIYRLKLLNYMLMFSHSHTRGCVIGHCIILFLVDLVFSVFTLTRAPNYKIVRFAQSRYSSERLAPRRR